MADTPDCCADCTPGTVSVRILPAPPDTCSGAPASVTFNGVRLDMVDWSVQPSETADPAFAQTPPGGLLDAAFTLQGMWDAGLTFPFPPRFPGVLAIPAARLIVRTLAKQPWNGGAWRALMDCCAENGLEFSDEDKKALLTVAGVYAAWRRDHAGRRWWCKKLKHWPAALREMFGPFDENTLPV